MKIAAYHKSCGDTVMLNEPLQPCEVSYGSWLYNQDYPTDKAGGPAVDPKVRLNGIDGIKPDYDLFNLEYSLGYSWRYCPRQCHFCVVPQQDNPKEHHSIWEFHDGRFDTICLLNNNTFSDPRWFDTFVEIWDAGLSLMEHGFDLRLMDVEHAKALKRTKVKGSLHFAWDSMRDQKSIIRGLDLLRRFNIKGSVYVLVGYDTTRQEDILRCEVIDWFGLDPYIMPYNGGGRNDRAFKRFVDLRFYRRFRTITEALETYR